MRYPNCVITGCALWIPSEGKALWGDLHELQGIWCFNGATRLGEGAAWQYAEPPASTKTLCIRDGAAYFERSGIVTVSKSDASLNSAALAYLES